MDELILTNRRLVDEDHIIVRLRVAFAPDGDKTFAECVARLAASIGGRAATGLHPPPWLSTADGYTLKVTACDEDGVDERDSNRGTVDIAVPVGACSPLLGFPLLLAIAAYGSVYSFVSEYQILDIHFPQAYVAHYSGPRIGPGALYRNKDASRPLLGLILKPRFFQHQADLARFVGEFAETDIDCLIDDELTVQSADMTFAQRVAIITDTLVAAGRSTPYIANVLGRTKVALELADRAMTLGAAGVMVNPITMGFDVLQQLATDPHFSGMVVANFIGRSIMTGGPLYRISPTLLCALARLAGADGMYIQPFYGLIRNSRSVAAQYKMALTGPFDRNCHRNPSVAVMSGNIGVPEVIANDDIYRAPLLLAFGQRLIDTWHAGVKPRVAVQCIRLVWNASKSGDKSHLADVVLELQKKSAGHKECLMRLGVASLV